MADAKPTDRPYPTPWRVVRSPAETGRTWCILSADDDFVLSAASRALLDRIVAAVNEREGGR